MRNMINRIVDTVNEAFPKYGMGVIAPPEMLATTKANCFGRLAVIGAGLIEEGVPQESIAMLISLNHGEPFATGRHWFGHTVLVVSEDPVVVIDSAATAIISNSQTSPWSTSPRDNFPLFAFDAQKAAEPEPTTDLEEIYRLAGPPHIYKQAPFMSVHEFADGLNRYQTGHLAYHGRQIWSAEDYAATYREITSDSLAATA